MAKQFSMGQVHSIVTPHQSGHSNRKIAELLSVNREMVARYLAKRAADPANPDHRVECQEQWVFSGMAEQKNAAQEKTTPGRLSSGRGSEKILPPWPGYPLLGCSRAKPDSVSPDISTLVRPSSSHQEPPHE